MSEQTFDENAAKEAILQQIRDYGAAKRERELRLLEAAELLRQHTTTTEAVLKGVQS